MDPKEVPKQAADSRLSQDSAALVELSHRIHSTPELAYEEVLSSGWIADLLEDGGMRVERGAYGLETAFEANAGRGRRKVILCAEYDALPEIGHACGHNIIAAASAGAGLALSSLADDLDLSVTVLGTPAEEGGGGKVDLLRAGAFEATDLAMMVHPFPFNAVDMAFLARSNLTVTYHGKEAHASAFPEAGVNALDAVTIAYAAINALRQHIKSTERVHGIIVHGGDASNVIPAMTVAKFGVRARTLEDLAPLAERVSNCFKAGALATGCEVEITSEDHDYAEVSNNPFASGIFERNFVSLGRNPLPKSDLERFAASTDMGNVSLEVPSIHPMVGLNSLPAVNHQADFAAHCISPDGDAAIIDSARAMAHTVIDVATTPGAFDRIREEFEQG